MNVQVLSVLFCILVLGCTDSADESGGGVCEGMAEGAIRDICYKSEAKASSNESICGLIEGAGQRGICYRDVAKELGKHGICVNISDPSVRKYCHYSVAKKTKNVGGCDQLDGEYMSWCMMGAANGAGDASLCERIPETFLRAQCVAETGQ